MARRCDAGVCCADSMNCMECVVSKCEGSEAGRDGACAGDRRGESFRLPTC